MPGLTFAQALQQPQPERIGRKPKRDEEKDQGDVLAGAGDILLENEDSRDVPMEDAVAAIDIKVEPMRPIPHRKVSEIIGTPPIPISMSPSRSLSRARESDADSAFENTPKLGNATGRARRRKKKALKKAAAANAAADPALRTTYGFTPTSGMSAGEESDVSSIKQKPRDSSADDSDFGTNAFKKRDLSAKPSVTSSPLLRPQSGYSSDAQVGGISALRKKIEDIKLDTSLAKRHAMSRLGNQMRTQNEKGTGAEMMARVPSNLSVGYGTDGAGISESEIGSDIEPLPEVTRYEVPLETDFISHDAVQQDKQQEEQKQKEDSNAQVQPMTGIETVHRKMTAEDFDPLLCLGKGAFGTVNLVRQKATGRLYAQKVFRKAFLQVQASMIEQTKTERHILESVNRHPFVVKLYYAFQDQRKLYLILEYAQGGELFTHLAAEGMFPEDTASFYMAEMVLAIEYLHHTVGVVYRDLKPENCLLDVNGHLLLTDFGLSKVAVDEDGVDHSCTSILGTVEYMAPEVVQGHAYDRAVDWWSLGALGFDLLTGSPPFRGNNHKKIQEKIVKAKLTMPYFLSPDAKDMLTRLLRKEPRKRLGACMPRDLRTIKAHRFFRKLDWFRLERRELEPPIRPLVTDPALAENFADEFTQLAVGSPVADKKMGMGAGAGAGAAREPESAGIVSPSRDPFGGFSFVASRSLLENGLWGMGEDDDDADEEE